MSVYIEYTVSEVNCDSGIIWQTRMNDSQSNYKSLHGRWELKINASNRVTGYYLIPFETAMLSLMQALYRGMDC